MNVTKNNQLDDATSRLNQLTQTANSFADAVKTGKIVNLKQNSQQKKTTAAQFPWALMVSAFALSFTSIGLGLYGMERDSGAAMFFSAITMIIGALLTLIALFCTLAEKMKNQF